MTVLLGRTTAGATGDFNAAGHSAAWTFVALASGQLKYLFSQTKVSNPTGTGVELGVYSDSAGLPVTRLGFAAVDDLTAARGTGIFRATLATPVTIVSGTTYWLARYMATEQCEFQGDAVASTYTETNNAADMPTPWDALTSAGGTTTIIWGEDDLVVSRPRIPPFMLKGPFALQLRRFPQFVYPVAGQTVTFDVTIDGTSAVAVQADMTRSLAVAIGGTGALTVAESTLTGLAVAIAGTGTLVVDTTRTRSLDVAIVGTGVVTTDFVRQIALSAIIAGTAQVVVDDVRQVGLAVSIAGSGTLVATLDLPAGGVVAVYVTNDLRTLLVMMGRHPSV